MEVLRPRTSPTEASPKTTRYHPAASLSSDAVVASTEERPSSSGGNRTEKKKGDESNRRSSGPPSIPLPSPMNDPTWLEYVERSGLMGVSSDLPVMMHNHNPPPRPRNNTNPLPPLVNPEISHLRSSSAAGGRRPSLENLGLGAAGGKVQQILSRGRNGSKDKAAKAAAAQEQEQRRKNKSVTLDQARVKKRTSVELIAEQYRAMLDYKDRMEEGFVYDEDEAVPPPVPRKDDEIEPVVEQVEEVEQDMPVLLQARTFDGGSSSPKSRSSSSRPSPTGRSSQHRHVTIEAPPPGSVDLGAISPQSDGTLVSFEEDVIYFKPVSFGPSPPPSPAMYPERASSTSSYHTQRRPSAADVSMHYPHHRMNSPSRRLTPPSHPPPPPPPQSQRSRKESRQLDIGLDLLRGELASSLARGRRQPGEDRVSDLQLSIMIDAYENLRERTKNMNLGEADRANMTRMFDAWVSTLHNIRGSLVPDRERHGSIA